MSNPDDPLNSAGLPLRATPAAGPAALFQQRCFQHHAREAVARCPACSRFFCRECVTEHADRLVCASCLAKQNAAAGSGRARWHAVWAAGQCLAACLLAWLCFYGLGRTLLLMPDASHAKSLWQVEEDPR